MTDTTTVIRRGTVHAYDAANRRTEASRVEEREHDGERTIVWYRPEALTAAGCDKWVTLPSELVAKVRWDK